MHKTMKQAKRFLRDIQTQFFTKRKEKRNKKRVSLSYKRRNEFRQAIPDVVRQKI